jgi:hypothetical protein
MELITTQIYLKIKTTQECNAKNIKLIHIWDSDWIYNKPIIKSMIKTQLGVNLNKIYARKCEVKLIDKITSTQFLNDNHLQKNVISKINLGLYYQNDLVAVMTFGKLRKNLNQTHTEGCYELLRFCNKLDHQIIGGASKLYSFFIKNYSPKEIFSYANRDWSEGKLYYYLGMNFLHYTTPGYHWYKSKIKYNRFSFRKDVLVKQGNDPNKTEYEIMLDKGFYRVWNTGNLKFHHVLKREPREI